MSVIRAPYSPNPKQVIFHTTGAGEVVYGGSKGGGKSCALVMEAAAYASEHDGAVLYLFRETYDDLEANVIQEWLTKVPKELYTYNASKHQAELYNGSKVFFRYVKSYEDALGYQGRSMDWIGVDELTMHEERTIQMLLSCLRSPQGFPPQFRGTCNPGGIGHQWVKNRYITPTNHGLNTVVDDVTGSTIAFVPATVYDNPVLMQNDPNYVRRLENLPLDQKKAFLYGDWDVFAGQYFREWRRDTHVVQPFEIPKWWRRYRSLDYGLDRTACIWWAVDNAGLAYAYRELYKPDLNLSQAAMSIIDMTPRSEKIAYTVASPDLWNRRQDTGRSGKDIMSERGLSGLIKADHRRIPGWRAMREWLMIFKDDQQQDAAKLRIFEGVEGLATELPSLIHDTKNPEDVSDRVVDHASESARYFIMSLPGKSVTPDEQAKRIRRREQLTAARVSSVTGY